MFRSTVLKYLVIVALLVAVCLPVTVSAAYNPTAAACSSAAAKASSVCKATGGDPITGPDGVLRRATRLIAVIAGAAAVIVMVISGIRYITSAGDSNQIAEAKKTIIFAIVGLVVIVVAESLITFVIVRI